MTRESLAKDILLTLIPTGDWSETKIMASCAVDLADALLEVLATKEAPASWLSKEMQQKTGTPAGCLPVLREGSVNKEIEAARSLYTAGVLSPTEYWEEITRIMRKAAEIPAPGKAEDAWEPRIGDAVKWCGCRRACTVDIVVPDPGYPAHKIFRRPVSE